MIGREDSGTLSTNHIRAFRHSFSKAVTGLKSLGIARHGEHYVSGPTAWTAMPAVCGGAGGAAAAAQTQTAGAGLTRGKAGSCAAVYVAAHNSCGQGPLGYCSPRHPTHFLFHEASFDVASSILCCPPRHPTHIEPSSHELEGHGMTWRAASVGGPFVRAARDARRRRGERRARGTAAPAHARRAPQRIQQGRVLQAVIL